MKIQANKQGVQAVQELCDIALKYGGMSLLQWINGILWSLEELPEDKKKSNT